MAKTVLNLYAGIGGNRKLWDNVDVTAIERDPEIADVYRDHFPNDTVIETDAHEYLKNNFDDFDFIWASPPCPTHSKFRRDMHGWDKPVYPDMKLWQEIIFLKGMCHADWVVENVVPYYEPLIEGTTRARHMFWSNFYIPEITLQSDGVKRQESGWQEIQERYGFDLSNVDQDRRWKRKVLNNCVHPKLGKHIFDAAFNLRQDTLF
jgi:DNA (cytosine-5)-methyltransferase 1